MPIGELIYKIRTVLFTFATILAIASTASTATYYVDATNGNDANNGLSTSTSWKTIGKANSSQFYSGDQILFNRGDTWREQLTVSSSGSPGSPITFGAYGSGVKPLIKPSQVVGANWVLISGSIYKFTASNTVKTLWLNDEFMVYDGRGSSPAAGHFMIDSSNANIVYVNDSSANSHSYSWNQDFTDAADDTWGININGKSYVTVQNLQVSNAAEAGVRIAYTASNIVLDSIDSMHNGNSTQGSYGVGNNYSIQYGDHINITIQNCTSDKPYDDGFCVEGLGYMVTGPITFTNCTSTNTGWGGNIQGQAGNLTAAGFSFTNTASGYYVNNITLSNSSATTSQGSGVYLMRSQSTTIKDSHFYSNNQSGIQVTNASTGTIEYNLMWNNNLGAGSGTGSNFSGHIEIWNGCSNLNIYNNVMYGNTGLRGVGLHVSNQDSNNVSNSNIKNNIIYGNAYADLRIQREWGSGVVLSNNDYSTSNGSSGGLIVYDDGAANRAYTVAQFATYQSTESQDANSMTANPNFVSSAVPDFHLQAGSPAIGAGTDVSLISNYSGHLVPYGKAPDIGAYRYSLSAPTNFRTLQ